MTVTGRGRRSLDETPEDGMEWAEVAAVATGFTTRRSRDARDRLQRGGAIEYRHGGKFGGGRVTRWKPVERPGPCSDRTGRTRAIP